VKSISMKLVSWNPAFHLASKADDDGGKTSYRYEDHTLVTVFTYAGGRHGSPFTTLEAYYHGHSYYVRLPQCYHPRWHGRLSRQFDWMLWREAVARENAIAKSLDEA
jgi:hypothetical protein